MKKITLTIAILASFITCFSQTITQVEDVFGGKINAITSGRIGTTDSFRVFISTESANSIFTTKMYVPPSAATSIDSFTALPSANSTAGLGSRINRLAYDVISEKLFFIHNGNIFKTDISASTTTQVTTTGGYIDVVLSNSTLVGLTATGSNNTVYISSLDASGNITSTINTSIIGSSLTQLVVGKDDNLYAFKGNTTDPQAYRFTGNFTTGLSTLSLIDNMNTLSTSYTWSVMGVAIDGSIYVGGMNSIGKHVANASSFGAVYTTVNTGISGVSGYNLEFRNGSAGNFYVYFGSAYSSNKGISGSWNTIGNVSSITHPNDGQVHFVAENPITGGALLMTTDQGIGITKNSGSIMFEANKGVNAVQVKDFDMNTTKDFGWLASKSGIRYVENYNTSSKNWSRAIFPNGDGSPYWSCEMKDKDTAYVGNVRVYRTRNRGNSWTQIFTPENAPYSFGSVGHYASSIAIGGTNNEIVMAGYRYENTSSGKGGVFYSLDYGNNWSQLLIKSTVLGQDVNVNDVEITTEGSNIVAYIGIVYDNTSSPTVRGMYKATLTGSSWSVSFEDVYGAPTSLYSIKDIYIKSKDTIFACGSFYNPSLGYEYPIHFSISKTVGNIWRSALVDVSRVGTYSSITYNNDSIFYAHNNKIYWDSISFYTTYTARKGEALYYSAPVGTEINVLYYDELLAGTETDIRSVKGATVRRPTPPTQTSRTNSCAGDLITGGTPSGGIYYIVDTAADGYIYTTSDAIIILFANHGVLTGATTMSINDYNSINFLGLNLVSFYPVTHFPSTPGNYYIAYTSNIFDASSSADDVNVTSSATIQPITGNLVNCGAIGSTTQLYNSTTGGTWSSTNSFVATVNNNGRVTATGFGSTTIAYTVVNLGCSSSVVANYKVAGLPMLPNIVGDNSICVGSSTSMSNSFAGGVWSISGRASISSNGLVMGLNTGNADVIYKVTNSAGCSSSTSKTIMVNSLPSTPNIVYGSAGTNPQSGAPQGSYCRNRSFNLVGSPLGGTWSSSGTISINSSGNAIIGNITGAGSVSYTVTNVNGCSKSRTISGNVVACASRSTEDVSKNAKFLVYPNPAKNVVNIKIDNLVGKGDIIFTDLLGKQIKHQLLSLGNNTIDISNLAKGMYLVKIIADNVNETKKLIIE